MIKLIAKPWKGGLGRYYFNALNQMFPGQVEWIKTRPTGFRNILKYKSDPHQWWLNLIEDIQREPYKVAIFIGYRDEFSSIKFDPRNVLYAVDAIQMNSSDLEGFSQIYLSDPGYEENLRTLIRNNQFGGILPFACLPSIHHPDQKQDEFYDICFIGNRDKKRDPYIATLQNKEISSLVVGNYFMKSPIFWQHPLSFRPAIPNEKMSKIYSQSKISLNIHASVVREGTNMRTFECASYGISQLIEYRPRIEEYFRPDEEIVLFSNYDDMIEKLRFLLSDADYRLSTARRARKRAMQEHTYYHRAAKILENYFAKSHIASALQNCMENYVS